MSATTSCPIWGQVLLYQPRIEVVGNGSASHKRPSGRVPFWSILVTRHSPFSRVGVLLQILASSVKPTISSPQPWSVEPSRRAAGSRRARQALGYLECHENRQLGSYTGHVFASVLPRALTISSRMYRDKSMRIYRTGLGRMLASPGTAVCREPSYPALSANSGAGVCEVCECVAWTVIAKTFPSGALTELLHHAIPGPGLSETG